MALLVLADMASTATNRFLSARPSLRQDAEDARGSKASEAHDVDTNTEKRDATHFVPIPTTTSAAIAIRLVESASHTARYLHTLTMASSTDLAKLNDITSLMSARTSPCSAVYLTLPGDNNHDKGDRQPASTQPSSARAVLRERLHVSTVPYAILMRNLLERQRVRSTAAVAPDSARVGILAVNAHATAATAHAPPNKIGDGGASTIGVKRERYDEFYLQGAWCRNAKPRSFQSEALPMLRLLHRQRAALRVQLTGGSAYY